VEIEIFYRKCSGPTNSLGPQAIGLITKKFLTWAFDPLFTKRKFILTFSEFYDVFC
jgi:hypothetical protein